MVRYLGGLEGLNADIQDKKHRTPLHIATERGNTRMMVSLIRPNIIDLNIQFESINF